MKPKLPSDSPIHVSRRDAIRGGAGLGAAGLLGCGSAGGERQLRATSAVGTPRVAILGAGAGGIAAAYFLAGDCDVTIFESREKIGGHADTTTITYQGQSYAVDVGAQFFTPATHPIYVTLLEELGLYNAANPGTNDQTIVAPGSLDVFPYGGIFNAFSSTMPYLTPLSAVDFAIYTQQARNAILGNISWDTTVSAWIASLPLTDGFKQSILFPWIAALIGTTHANAAVSSVRSILQTFALAFPANLLQGATTCNSKIGLQGNLQTMLSSSPIASLQLNSPVQSLSFANGAWTVTTPAGSFGPFDAIVVNIPPHTSAGLLQPLSWAADIVSFLQGYEYFSSRLVIHSDPAYVYWDRDFWAAYNAETTGLECEGSVWLGAFQPKLPNGGTVDVFKSWVNQREVQPRNILAERTFLHPLITPSVIQATRSLNGVQGRNGLYFSGQHTTGMDLQEAAVFSAMQVADALAPSSATLASLRARLQANGLTGISYDP